MHKYNVAIIGAGPAGIACAIQLNRYRTDFIIFEKDEAGGLLRNANLVENYPGFPEGIEGEKLASLFCKQLKINKIRPVKETVTYVDYKEKFLIKTDEGTYEAEILVIASGTKPKQLDIKPSPSIEANIFYEIVKLKKLRDKKIGIIGSGDAAFDYALNLCGKNKIFLLNRTEKYKCLPLLFERCIKNRNIKYIPSFAVAGWQMKDKGLILYSKNKEIIFVDYLVIAIGRYPNCDFLTQKLKSKLQALEKSKKLYMIGDVKNGLFRQTAIAVGDGIKTGMEIGKRLFVDNQWNRSDHENHW